MDEESESAVGITDYELVALVDMDVTPQGRRVLGAVGVSDLLDDPTAVRAGYASLLVRGVAGLDDDGIVAQGPGAAIGTMVASADDILLLILSQDGLEFARSVLVDASVGSFLLDQTDYGVHAAQPLEQYTDLLALVHDIIDNMADGHGPEGPFDAAITRPPVDGPDRTVVLHVASRTDWRTEGSDAEGEAAAWRAAVRALGRSDAELSSGARHAH